MTRFRDEREQAVNALIPTMPRNEDNKEERARRILKWHKTFPQPRSVDGISYGGGLPRTQRRANGQVKGRTRLRGKIPPHPAAVIFVANRIERQGIKQRAKMARQLAKAGYL